MSTLSMEAPQSPGCSRPPGETPAHALRLFGVGTAGMRLLSHLAARQALPPTAWVVLPAWDPMPTLPEELRCLRLESAARLSWGAMGDPDSARAMAQENYDRLSEACTGAEWVWILAGLGGGSGSGMAPVLARAAREAGARVIAVALTPFQWEGTLRHHQAQTALEELRAVADGLVCLPNQKLHPLLPQPTPLLEAYQRVNELLGQGLEAFFDLMTHRGLVPLPLEKLCALLRGRHAESVLVTARAAGADRLAVASQALLQHPLLEEGQTLLAATSVVIHVTGGPDLAVGEVDGLVQLLGPRCGHAEVLVGAAVRPDWSGELRVLLVVTRRGERLVRNGQVHAGATAGPEVLREVARYRMQTIAEAPAGGDPLDQDCPGPSHAAGGTAVPNGNPRTYAAGRRRNPAVRLRQGMLPLNVLPRGRFEKTQPNIHRGEDLDIPTYIRRGIILD